MYVHDILNASYSETACQIMSTHPDKVDANIVNKLKPIIKKAGPGGSTTFQCLPFEPGFDPS
jgi:hypothetical protein